MESRAPAPPTLDNVQRQFGEDADLYADVRAETAKAIGLEDEAETWTDVKTKIAKQGPAIDRDEGGESVGG